MQYDTIEELMLELSLYPNKKIDILEGCAGKYIFQNNKENYDWFTVAKDGNCALFTKDGKLDDINKVKILSYHMIADGIEKINIPDGVTSIEDKALAFCSRLTSVMIPDSVMSIGSHAFWDCSELTSITIPNSVTSIGDYAFAFCSRLTSMTILGNVKSIGQQAFDNCHKLTGIAIPASVTSIGKYAFNCCFELKEVIFKGKTIDQVRAMENYPWGIEDESIIKCEESLNEKKTMKKRYTKKQIIESIRYWQKQLKMMDEAFGKLKIWVDDVRPAPNDYRLVQSVNEFIKLAEEVGLDNIAIVDIDHDAGDFQKDGGDYIKILDWLEFNKVKDLNIRIHSANPVGVANMRRIIQKNGWTEIFDIV